MIGVPFMILKDRRSKSLMQLPGRRDSNPDRRVQSPPCNRLHHGPEDPAGPRTDKGLL